MTRAEITSALKRASVGYFVHRGFSCHEEVGLVKWGRRRADILAFNTKLEIVVAEIKSCWADFASDKKWQEYLTRANRVFLVFDAKTFESRKEQILAVTKDSTVGILVLNAKTGLLEAKRSTRIFKLPGAVRRELITRIAYRNGKHKGNTKRSREYIVEYGTKDD